MTTTELETIMRRVIREELASAIPRPVEQLSSIELMAQVAHERGMRKALEPKRPYTKRRTA